MKKYFLTMATLALFAIGFVASDEDESSSSENANSTPQTEQKQETEADRQAKEEEEKQAKIDKMMKEAYERGKSEGMTYSSYKDCDVWFSKRWFTPSTDEEFEIYRKYKKEYDRGFDDGHAAKQRMKNM